MQTPRTRRNAPWRAPAAAVAAAAISAIYPAVAHAHFSLLEPACYSEQDDLGNPQKSAPCGQADPGKPVQATGDVTTFVQGQKITLTIEEGVFHPGHYRVSIAPDQDSLPADPPVTAGSTPCGSTEIETDPQLPLVADGLLVHTSAFSGKQSVEITLPPDLTCTNCVLQVSEFMSSHGLNNPGGCFYHHCAVVSIVPREGEAAGAGGAGGGAGEGGAAPTSTSSSGSGNSSSSSSGAGEGGAASTSASAGEGGAASTGGGESAESDTDDSSSSSGCGCRVGAAETPTIAGAAGLLALGLLGRRRTRATRALRPTKRR
ncbi:SCE4755 family polysaccharide monooxygenase-like protein [Sorangium sp. So ce1000]|uniref:SCE4755 family polysaccharide monooxygenase-like protein n=1 Tax=Sorangium sp. So ce1000 TaxID=3133325 RepID=UPI003F638151